MATQAPSTATASSSTTSSTTSNTTEYRANEKRKRPEYRYSERKSFYRTVFPGYRPRYLCVASIGDCNSDLYESCAALWPEFFSESAPCAFSWERTPDKPTPYDVKGLIGIAFHHPRIDGLVNIPLQKNREDLEELEWAAWRKAKAHVAEMAKKGISVQQTAMDIILVREGRDEVKVQGHARVGAYFWEPHRFKPMIIGAVECKTCLGKRKRETEAAGERTTQRRRG